MDFDLNKYLKTIYKDKFDQIYNSFYKPKDICVFINLLKCTHEILENEFKKHNLNYIKINEFCYRFAYENKSILTKTQAFNNAFFYIQNYSSFLCAKNLNVNLNDEVLDMCAAPGGKSINLANFMQNSGYLACVESSKDRFFILKENLAKYNVKNSKCFLKDAKTIGNLCTNKFDKILLDAPCSTFAKFGDKISKNKKEIKQISLIQKKLLNSALKALKSGGILVYSTCTFLEEENEDVLLNALNSNIKFKFLNLDLENVEFIDGLKDLWQTKRIIPNDFNDGFFIAKIQKL